MNTKIDFSDGYSVSITGEIVIITAASGKSARMNASHFKPIPSGHRAEAHLIKSGKTPADYLLADPCGDGGQIVRAGNGVREAIAECVAEIKAAKAARDAKHAAEQAVRDAAHAEKVAACGLAEPVKFTCKYCDGTPYAYETFKGHPLNLTWQDVREIDGQYYAERAAIEAANRAGQERRAAAEAAKLTAETERSREFADKLAEARRTGDRVVLSRWTTDRCMNGNGSECSFDSATKFVLPDGTTKTIYGCCY